MAVYACSDLHGYKDLYNKIKLFLDPEDKVYFLGDANDRGPQSWELMNAILGDDQFIYLRGNHEDMFICAALDALLTRDRTNNVTTLFQNGGANTLSGFAKAGKPSEIIDRLMDLPTHAEYENEDGKIILMSHAGYTPKLVEAGIELPCEWDLVWGRSHITDKWDGLNFEDYIVVHGHTPSVYIANDVGYTGREIPAGAFWYADGHKVCIDNACYDSGFAVLLNLDTLEDIVIETDC